MKSSSKDSLKKSIENKLIRMLKKNSVLLNSNIINHIKGVVINTIIHSIIAVLCGSLESELKAKVKIIVMDYFTRSVVKSRRNKRCQNIAHIFSLHPFPKLLQNNQNCSSPKIFRSIIIKKMTPSLKKK